jgi:excisionase family DNA binding protein
MRSDTTEGHLTLAEIAERLGVAVSTLKRMAKEGRVPPFTGPTSRLKGWSARMYTRWVDAGMPDAKTFRRIDPGD